MRFLLLCLGLTELIEALRITRPSFLRPIISLPPSLASSSKLRKLYSSSTLSPLETDNGAEEPSSPSSASIPSITTAPPETLSPDPSPPLTAIPATQVTPPPVARVSLPPHPKMVQRRLENGFTYIILPNKTPANRFEAHLEVMSGSAHELERQQGMAHLLEHVAYMGSPKRQLISGTGSRTNAYTDFVSFPFAISLLPITPFLLIYLNLFTVLFVPLLSLFFPPVFFMPNMLLLFVFSFYSFFPFLCIVSIIFLHSL